MLKSISVKIVGGHSLSKIIKCEGNCEETHDEHKGEIKRVQVYSKSGKDWGEFWYCENAIKEDIKRGMKICEIQ